MSPKRGYNATATVAVYGMRSEAAPPKETKWRCRVTEKLITTPTRVWHRNGQSATRYDLLTRRIDLLHVVMDDGKVVFERKSRRGA